MTTMRGHNEQPKTVFFTTPQENTYERQDERDPHEKVEATKDIVERLLPVLGRWRTDDVLAILGPALDGGIVQPMHGVRGVARVDLLRGDEVDVDARDGIGRIRARLGLSRQLLLVNAHRKRSIAATGTLSKRIKVGQLERWAAFNLPDLNAIARDSVPPRGRHPRVRLLELRVHDRINEIKKK